MSRPRVGEVTIRERILESELYQSGEVFGPTRMAKELGELSQSVRHSLDNMNAAGLAQRCGGGLYKKPRIHALHRFQWNRPAPAGVWG